MEINLTPVIIISAPVDNALGGGLAPSSGQLEYSHLTELARRLGVELER